jgi:hypothetical protein
MRLLFFARRHQKLNADTEVIQIPGLPHHPSDDSSGSGSLLSFDPTNYTLNALISKEIPVTLRASPDITPPSTGRSMMSDEPRLRQLEGKKAKPSKKEKVRLLIKNLGKLSKSGGRISKELAELDKTVMSLRARDKSISESPHIRPATVKAHQLKTQETGGAATWSKPKDLSHLNSKDVEQVPRVETWGRRVSSLEACFKNESTKKFQSPIILDKSLESVIMKGFSFDTYGSRRRSRDLSFSTNGDDSPGLPSEPLHDVAESTNPTEPMLDDTLEEDATETNFEDASCDSNGEFTSQQFEFTSKRPREAASGKLTL